MSVWLFRKIFGCSPKGLLDHQTWPLETMSQFRALSLPSHAHRVTERDVDTGDEHTHAHGYLRSSLCLNGIFLDIWVCCHHSYVCVILVNDLSVCVCVCTCEWLCAICLYSVGKWPQQLSRV